MLPILYSLFQWLLPSGTFMEDTCKASINLWHVVIPPNCMAAQALQATRMSSGGQPL